MGTEALDRHSPALRMRERGDQLVGGDRTGTAGRDRDHHDPIKPDLPAILRGRGGAGWDLAAHRPDLRFYYITIL